MVGHVVAEIRKDAIRGNLQAIRRCLGPGVAVCAMVKANAYGHGLDQVLPILMAENVERVAVAQLPEALQIRRNHWDRPILCLGAPLAETGWRDRREWAAEAVVNRIRCTISTTEEARLLGREAAAQQRPAHVEIKIDTGMGRMGLLVDDAAETVAEIATCPGIVVEGVYTHLACSDETDPAFTHEQLARFANLVETLRGRLTPVTGFHVANSAAIFRFRQSQYGMVRPGLALYGYWAGPANERPASLTPSMRLVGELVAVRPMPPQHGIGYGRTYVTQIPSRIAVVPLGYADGYRRALSNQAFMTLEPVRGQPARRVPVVGRVSMDQVTVDVTRAGDVRVGDRVVIIDDDPASPHSVENLARQLDTIPYEITCLIGDRIKRVTV